MARRYGNAGNVSSLISSARSAYEKSQSLQDQIEGYNWELSAKTAEDAQKYVDYLGKRAKSYEGIDQSKQITLQQKANSANRSFVSAETGRLSNQVLEGNISNTQKYAQLKSLYQQAVDNGDDNLAQRLYGNLDRLSMTIQNEQAAAASAASAAGDKAYTATKKGFTSKISEIDTNIAALKARANQMNTAEYQKTLSQLVDMKTRAYAENTGLDNPLGLNEEDYKKFKNEADKYSVSKDVKDLGGYKGIQATLNPDSKVRNANGDLVDNPNIYGYKQAVNKDYQGFDPLLLQNPSKEVKGKYQSAFKKLGFTGDSAQPSMQIRDINGNLVNAKVFVDNPDNPSFAYTIDPNGVKYQVSPDGSAKMLQDTPDGSIMPASMQAQFPSEIRKKQQADSTVSNRAAIKYTPLGQVGNSIRRFGNGNGTLTDLGNAASFGVAGSLFNIGGDAFSKLAQITGYQKQLDAKKAAEAAAAAAQRQREAQVMAQQQTQIAAANSAVKKEGGGKPYNPLTNTYTGAVGPVNTTAAQKAAKTIGSAAFNKKYLGI